MIKSISRRIHGSNIWWLDFFVCLFFGLPLKAIRIHFWICLKFTLDSISRTISIAPYIRRKNRMYYDVCICIRLLEGVWLMSVFVAVCCVCVYLIIRDHVYIVMIVLNSFKVSGILRRLGFCQHCTAFPSIYRNRSLFACDPLQYLFQCLWYHDTIHPSLAHLVLHSMD